MDGVAVIHPNCRRTAIEPVAQPALPREIDMIVVEGDPFAVPVALIAACFRMHVDIAAVSYTHLTLPTKA